MFSWSIICFFETTKGMIRSLIRQGDKTYFNHLKIEEQLRNGGIFLGPLFEWFFWFCFRYVWMGLHNLTHFQKNSCHITSSRSWKIRNFFQTWVFSFQNPEIEFPMTDPWDERYIYLHECLIFIYFNGIFQGIYVIQTYRFGHVGTFYVLFNCAHDLFRGFCVCSQIDLKWKQLTSNHES